MLNEQQNKKMLSKLKRAVETFDAYIFQPIGQLDYRIFETKEDFRSVPDDSYFTEPGETWGGEGSCCWFKGTYTPPADYANQPLYIMPHVGGYEAILWIDGEPYGNFATKITVTGHSNHYCDRICARANPEKPIEIAIEFYAGHYIIGCYPFETSERSSHKYTPGAIDICIKNQAVADFIYDLRILVQLAEMLDTSSYRRAEVMNTLTEVHKVLYYSPENADTEVWMAALEKARRIMAPSLARKNGDSAPTAVLTGHSHMDTAWLWPIKETIKKNARTISNQLSFMEEFPEYRFIQSSAYHSKMMEENYPGLFKRMKEQVAAKRYEPNGAVWIECDCNIPSGEAMIRQFLWGQRYTKEKFNYLSDCFWLPDTFGYSAAIPQIMKGFGVKYFLTTKLFWNDTNDFPFDSFVWEGLDSSQVIVHFFDIETWPDPKGLIQRISGAGRKNSIKCKQATDSHLVTYGFGDGGGGPQFEMIEVARRLENLEGCPKVRYSSVSDFMAGFESRRELLPKYSGELYLELHRGTLTGKQQIKKNNRFAEKALRNLEILEVIDAVREKRAASDKAYRSLWEVLLVNQFHDILPGSCISIAHDQSIAETTELIKKAEEMIDEKLPSGNNDSCFAVFNPLGTSRSDIMYLPVEGSFGAASADVSLKTQQVTMPDGSHALAVAGFEQKPLSFGTIRLEKCGQNDNSAFRFVDNVLETPFAKVAFDDRGYISSFIDKRNSRELCGGRLPLNSFMTAEDVPEGWDCWDIDADSMLKLKSDAELVSRSVVSDGAVEFRIRSEYKVCRSSRIMQDMVFHADSPAVTFDTCLEWRDKHRLLKAAFDTTIRTQYASHEIQFGNIKRPVTRNNSIEQAMFEVCNHKYTDLSEPGYGVSLLNDCKYGISVEGSCMSLSLAKGGLRPDDRGDAGDYRFKYSFLPHTGGFSAGNVINKAYDFNYERLFSRGSCDTEPFMCIDAANIVVEAIKPCEDSQNAFIIRLYEAEGTHTNANITLGTAFTRLESCDMLEQPEGEVSGSLVFHPFEIKTIKVSY